MQKIMDYYKILGINDNASNEDIKTAFRNLAKEWHPDANKHPRDEATKRFAEISTAYEVLSDPGKRKKYDFYRNYTYDFNSFNGHRTYTHNTAYDKEWDDLSRWFSEIYEKHLRKAQQQVNIFLNRIRRGFIGATVGFAIGVFFKGALIPLVILGWLFGFYLFRGK